MANSTQKQTKRSLILDTIYVYELEILDQLQTLPVSKMLEVRFKHATQLKFSSTLATIATQKKAIDFITTSDRHTSDLSIISWWGILCMIQAIIFTVILAMSSSPI